MGYDEMLDIANAAAISLLGGEGFTASLNGVSVKDLKGLFDAAVETVSPHDAETVILRPGVTFPKSDFDGLGKEHVFTRGKTGIAYRIFGEPRPDGAGMVALILVKA